MATQKQSSSQQYWLDRISEYEREFKDWEARAEKILKRYRDKYRDTRRANDMSRFNILWSNVQTMRRVVFSRLPKPDVSRRFKDSDPVGRVASEILERALDFEVQHYPDYRSALKNAVTDRFLPGRGIAWVRYEPHFQAPVQITEDFTEDADSQDELEYECSPTDYVHWRDFGHVVARTWEEVPAVWRRVYMNREMLVERFGDELGNKIPLDSTPEELKKYSSSSAQVDKMQACVYEIWDKADKTALWLSKSMPDILDQKDDPLKLESFWPCPRPLFATLTSDSLVPIPDFVYYQDQANALDTLADRIDGLVKALKISGVYNSAIPELARLFTEAWNGNLIAVRDWTAFAEKNGLKGAIDIVDLAPISKALIDSYQAFEQLKGQIYDITGISDIIRGETNASETATAQAMKGQYANIRLGDAQMDVAQFAGELLQIKAQIMCNLYQPQTLLQIASVEQLSSQDQQLIPQAMELLKRNTLRDFRIEVASDSMVQLDEKQEKQDAMELVQAIGAYFKEALPIAQAAPPMVPLIMELLKFAITRFRVGRSLEGMIDEVAQQLKQSAMQPKPPPPPDPAVQAAQIKAQADMAQTQADMQVTPIRAQAEVTKAQAEVIKSGHALQQAHLQTMMPPPNPMPPQGGMPQ